MMINKHYVFDLETVARPYFYDVTEKIQAYVKSQNIQNGIVNIYSQHTSCCVIIQEESEDVTYWNMQFLLQDTLNSLNKIIPCCEYEGQYLHPGPIHVANAMKLRGEEASWCLNTDGHIKSSILGRSETIPIADGTLILGEFGRIYFGDLDHVRARTRKVHVHILGE
jgi:secondary thiamine-phosphate synthase enzyme